MTLISRIPAPPLSMFVSVLWYANDWKPLHPRERHLPDGSVNLIIPLQNGSRGIVSGPRSESFLMKTNAAPQTLIGAQFTHGGAAVLFDAPVSDLSNRHIALGDLVPSEFLREELLECSTGEACLERLEQWLRGRMLGRSEPDRAIFWAVRELRQPQTRVAQVSAQIGRSSRWFINRFASIVGLTPKTFSRVQRFQAALRQVRPSMNLADLAVSCGYFDQAHLIHEFNRLAGMSPTALLDRRTKFLNHVVDRDSS